MTIYRDLSQYDPTTKEDLTDAEVLYQAIHNVIATRKGERPFNPDFGVNLEDSLFDLIDERTAAEIFQEVTEAISRFEPRVIINFARTNVVPYPDENKYELTVAFQIRGFGDHQYEFVGDLTASVS